MVYFQTVNAIATMDGRERIATFCPTFAKCRTARDMVTVTVTETVSVRPALVVNSVSSPLVPSRTAPVMVYASTVDAIANLAGRERRAMMLTLRETSVRSRLAAPKIPVSMQLAQITEYTISRPCPVCATASGKDQIARKVSFFLQLCTLIVSLDFSVLLLLVLEVCPYPCSVHGRCKSGRCECEFGWTGDRCHEKACLRRLRRAWSLPEWRMSLQSGLERRQLPIG